MTIAVFDSGFGGLTVLRELMLLIPGADYVYLGDTARLPYGAKSRATVVRYAVSSAAFLLAQGADLMVVACNTATALALDEIRAAMPIPVVGVIEPGTRAAAIVDVTLPQNPPQTRPHIHVSVLVLATVATVESAAYGHAFSMVGLAAYEKACPLLVPLVEEGWIEHPVTAEVLRIYLREALEAAPDVTTLVLGCTHYPLLKGMIERTLLELGHPMTIVDSATATAMAAAKLVPVGGEGETGSCRFFATDSIEKFRRLGGRFLGRELPAVELVDLGG